MNEVRSVLTALRSPTRNSTLSNSAVGIATTTWYDIPAPVIVHCREFRDDTQHNTVVKDDDKTEEHSRNNQRDVESESSTKNLKIESCEKITEIGSDEENTKNKFLNKNTPDKGVSSFVNDSEVLYQNNLALNSVDKTYSRESSMFEMSSESNIENKDQNRKRYSSTLEMNATTTVKTDVDGVPTISFSFLCADEKCHTDSEDEVIVMEVETDDQPDFSGNQLYDLPKPAVVENNQISQADEKEITGNFSSTTTSQDFYDVPKPTGDTCLNSTSREEKLSIYKSNQEIHTELINMIDSSNSKTRRDYIKRSSRSLKTGRRSYGASDSDGYDAGIASMSGSYSDPECPNDTLSTGGSGRSKRLSLQKRRLGKAWNRMRSWLRDERIRIGEVVNRHARLQAVGALNSEVA